MCKLSLLVYKLLFCEDCHFHYITFLNIRYNVCIIKVISNYGFVSTHNTNTPQSVDVSIDVLTFQVL